MFLLFFQTGCWNAREINELAFVLSVALDKADNGFQVTAQIAKPELYNKTQSGGSGGTEKEKPFWIVSATGKSIFEAIRNMTTISPRRIFWSHIKIIIIGEELARGNVQEIFDFFSRNPELRFRTWIAVTPGEAKKVVEIVPTMEKDPSLNIEKIIEKINLSGKAYSIMLKDFLEDYLETYINPVASRIIIVTEDNKPVIKLEGAAVFKDTQMTGWLNDTETRGLLWLENKISGSVKVVNCPYDGLPVTLEIKSGKANINSSIDRGVPTFTIRATATAKLTEKACSTQYTSPEALNKLEKSLEDSIREDIQAAVSAAQNLGSDIIDFSGALHRQHKEEWQKFTTNWPEIFSKAKVNIQVKANIPEVALLAKSLRAEKNSGGRSR
jgi:spore germination protein KC